MNRPLRAGLGLVAVLNLALALAFAVQAPVALRMWPLASGRLSLLFIASILAAVSAGALWIAVTGELGSLRAGALNLAVTMGGVSVSLSLAARQPGREELLPYALGAAALAVANTGFFVGLRHHRPPGSEPLPRVVRGSYVAFTVLLLAIGAGMVAQLGPIVPWPTDAETAAVIGWIFVGDACYFLYAARHPDWRNARAQLWSFLAYDVALIGPLVASVGTVPGGLLPNLIAYIGVLVFSGGLAVFYLLLNPATRVWPRAPARPAAEEATA